MAKILVTAENIEDVRDLIGVRDQADEIQIGQKIETWPITYEPGGQRGQMTVYCDSQRAALCLGGDSIWGDWDPETRTLRTEEGDEFDAEGQRAE